MIGEIYRYLGGDPFLDGHLVVGSFYNIESVGEIDGNEFVTFNETKRACYINILMTHFKNISKERDLMLTTLLD